MAGQKGVAIAEPLMAKAGWREATNDSLRAPCEWSKGGRPKAGSAVDCEGLHIYKNSPGGIFDLLINRDRAGRRIQGIP